MKAYRVVSWDKHFETAENRKLLHFTWVKLPTKQEGDGYTALMGDHPNGCAHFGAWTALVQLAAKCPARGVLTRSLAGRVVPHSVATISRITRVPVAVLEEAIPRLIEIGWLEEVDPAYLTPAPGLPAGADGFPADADGHPGVRGEESRGEKKRGEGEESAPTPQASPSQSSPPGEPEDPAARGRRHLLTILTAREVALEFKGEPIFDEWCRTCTGFRAEWIDLLLREAKPAIKYPSEMRALLKKKSDRYQTWKATRDQG